MLRHCPTCDGPVTKDLGLRDYSWVNSVLPGRLGGMDIDFCVNQAATGRVLMMEFKPQGVQLSTGAKLTYQLFVRAGFDVWVAWENRDGSVTWTGLDEDGNQIQRIDGTREELAQEVLNWWNAGLE